MGLVERKKVGGVREREVSKKVAQCVLCDGIYVAFVFYYGIDSIIVVVLVVVSSS